MNIRLPHSLRSQYGFSLVELMIVMVAGMFLTGGLISLFTNMVGSNSTTIRSTRLQQELRGIMNIMANDIRRAGSWGNAISSTQGNNPNPFTANTTDLMVLTSGTNIVPSGTGGGAGAGQCVLYTYDFNPGDQSNPAGSDVDGNEYFGFRWDSTYNILYMRSAGTTTNDCDDGTWGAINDSAVIEITGVNFNNQNYDCNNVTNPANSCTQPGTIQTIRRINITLTGQLAADPASARTLTETILVRNDQIVVIP